MAGFVPPEDRGAWQGTVLAVDLNADMGEGMPGDDEMFSIVSSANIACGGHAGDPVSMRRSVELALRYGVAIGAHPSYPDRLDFGRSDMLESAPGTADRPLPFNRLRDLLTGQIAALQAICIEMGTRLHHVKPHGALYNRAAKDLLVAGVVVEALEAASPGGPPLLLYGLSGSLMQSAATEPAARFVSEVFADRTYRSDGSLTPRSAPDALIGDQSLMLRQVLMMIREGMVHATDGRPVPLRADSICLHGDGPHAVLFAKVLRQELERQGISVLSPI